MYHIGGTPFPIWNRSCSMSNRFLKRQVRWSGIPISFRIFQFIVIHIVKGFGIVNKAEIDVFLELSCFFDDPEDVGNSISGSSAFSKQAWTSASSWFTYCWSLAWRTLSITLLACEMSAIISNHYFELYFFSLLFLSSPSGNQFTPVSSHMILIYMCILFPIFFLSAFWVG